MVHVHDYEKDTYAKAFSRIAVKKIRAFKQRHFFSLDRVMGWGLQVILHSMVIMLAGIVIY